MERLKLKYDQAKKAIESIAILLQKRNVRKEEDEFLLLVFQESLIKRFEYSVDTLWKYLKIYLEKKHGKLQKSPKDVFRECLRVGLLSEQQTKQALDMIDDRNMTSHTYNETIATEISEAIPHHYKLMKDIINSTLPE